jgi:hypothetical protein
MTATEALTEDLKKQVIALEDDLRRRVDEDLELHEEWQRVHRQATVKERTAWSWAQWRDDRVTQTAVAWVLMSVFIRFCEDNGLVKPVWITGPGRRRQEALDAELAFFREHGTWTEREWLEEAVAYLGRLPATKALVDTHSALRYASPSGDAIEELIKFWRNRSDDGKLVHDLQDETLSTRFLGDLYQNLSKYAQETYALLQTPVFVEEHILDRALEPALQERPLEGFRMIDPTCGSGHFLLGAFDRLLDRWHKYAPAMEIQARVQSALDAIHGVDLNPFAVAIARFRLTVAALKACDLRSLEDAPAFRYRLAVGDSLVHGPDSNVLPGMEERGAFMPFHYATEDAQLLLELLEEGRYDTVVGNPPYITVKDKALNKIYRAKFSDVCKGKYALTAPFMAEFFALAKRGEQSGWVGMITSNSFMKREFGTNLIEKFLVHRDLRLIEDTSGAYIPGHGTPTVIIIGRNRPPETPRVRAVLGVRGEPGRPDNPAEGIVWTSIIDHVDDPGWDDGWITVTDLNRDLFKSHPWSLSGGGAAELGRLISNGRTQLKEVIDGAIGFAGVPGMNEIYYVRRGYPARIGAEVGTRTLIDGKSISDWEVSPTEEAFAPYRLDSEELLPLSELTPWMRHLWPLRSQAKSIKGFSGDRSGPLAHWWAWQQWSVPRHNEEQLIAYAFVSTHNEFILTPGKPAINHSAPVIKLRRGESRDTYFGLLGVLNSSIACFWLKQNSQPKPSNGVKRGYESESWTVRYDFNGSTVEEFPLPESLPSEHASMLNRLAHYMISQDPFTKYSSRIPTRDGLGAMEREGDDFRARMIAFQEELDWEEYRLYGLIDEDLTYASDDLPGLALGERAFEIALAKSGEETAWFQRHESKPVRSIPTQWPVAYREIVQRRLNLIAEHPYIRLLEKPEYKRRWLHDSWDKRQDRMVRGWLLDRLEDRRFWFDNAGNAEPRSVGQLADEVARDADMVSVLALWEGRPDVPVSESLRKLIADEAVPFLAAYRYTDSGLRKRQAWEKTWELQRREDSGERVGMIPVPPKYAQTDFQKQSFWKVRDKLDVPQERFILYPDANRQGDPTMLLGWAGWDHAEQSLALSRIIGEREQEGWDDERLVPLVAGLAELQPWVEQWHSEVDERYGVSMAAFCQEQLDQRAAQVGKTPAELAAWRPAPSGRGRKPRAKGGAE